MNTDVEMTDSNVESSFDNTTNGGNFIVSSKISISNEIQCSSNMTNELEMIVETSVSCTEDDTAKTKKITEDSLQEPQREPDSNQNNMDESVENEENDTLLGDNVVTQGRDGVVVDPQESGHKDIEESFNPVERGCDSSTNKKFQRGRCYRKAAPAKSTKSRDSFYCPFCQVTFCSNFSLMRHLVQIHEANTISKTSSSTANTSTKRKGTCKDNVPTSKKSPSKVSGASSSGTMPTCKDDEYYCWVCGIVFDHLYKLGKHMMKHDQESPLPSNPNELEFEANDDIVISNPQELTNTNQYSSISSYFSQTEMNSPFGLDGGEDEAVNYLCTLCHQKVTNDGCHCTRMATQSYNDDEFPVPNAPTKRPAVISLPQSQMEQSNKGRMKASCAREGTSSKKMPCPLCNSYFGRAQWVGRHMKKVHGKNLREYQTETMSLKTYSCSICNVRFKNSTSLKNHTENIHLDVNRFERKESSTGSNEPVSVTPRLSSSTVSFGVSDDVNSVGDVNNETEKSSETTEQNQKSSAAYNFHRRSTKRKILCQHCGGKFGSIAWLTRHMRVEHNMTKDAHANVQTRNVRTQSPSRTCEAMAPNTDGKMASAVGNTESLRIKHDKRKSMNTTKFICEECGAKFRNLAWLTRHCRCTSHGGQIEAHSECPLPNDTSEGDAEEITAKTEMASEELEESMCSFCKYKCMSKASLIGHILTFHSDKTAFLSPTNHQNAATDTIIKQAQYENNQSPEETLQELANMTTSNCHHWIPQITSVVALNPNNFHDGPSASTTRTFETSVLDTAVTKVSKNISHELDESQWSTKFKEFVGASSSNTDITDQSPEDNKSGITEKSPFSSTSTFVYDLDYKEKNETPTISTTSSTADASVNYYYCSYCEYKEKRKEQVICHLSIIHAGVPPYRCRLCTTGFFNRLNLLKHVKDLHDARYENAELSVLYVQDNSFLKLSIEDNIAYGHEDSFRKLSTQDDDNLDCPFCPYKGKRPCHLTLHMKRHQPRADAVFKCPFCPFYVTQKKPLMAHMSLHIRMSQSSFKKMVTLKQSGDDETLQVGNSQACPSNSSTISTGIRKPVTRRESLECSSSKASNSQCPQMPYSCENCPFRAFTKIHYLYHKQFHRPNHNAPFRCHTCCYWSNRKSEMAVHLSLHVRKGHSTAKKVDALTKISVGGGRVVGEAQHSNNCSSPRFQTAASKAKQQKAGGLAPKQLPPPILLKKRKLSPSKPEMSAKRLSSISPRSKKQNETSSRRNYFLPEDNDTGCRMKNESKHNWRQYAYEDRETMAPPPHKWKKTSKIEMVDCNVTNRGMLSRESKDSLSFEEENEIRQQILVYPRKTGVHSFRCSVCPASFTRPSVLRFHESLHGCNEIYRCTDCNYAVNNRNNLRTHLLLHYYFSDESEFLEHSEMVSKPAWNSSTPHHFAGDRRNPASRRAPFCASDVNISSENISVVSSLNNTLLKRDCAANEMGTRCMEINGKAEGDNGKDVGMNSNNDTEMSSIYSVGKQYYNYSTFHRRFEARHGLSDDILRIYSGMNDLNSHRSNDPPVLEKQ